MIFTRIFSKVSEKWYLSDKIVSISHGGLELTLGAAKLDVGSNYGLAELRRIRNSGYNVPRLLGKIGYFRPNT